MFCVLPEHKDLSEEDLKGEKNEATYLVTVRGKPPRCANYLLVCCKLCAFNFAGKGRFRKEFWDRVPRDSTFKAIEDGKPVLEHHEPWVHLVLTEMD